MHEEFDGFSIHLFYEKQDDDWIAHFVEKPTISAFGSTPDQALEELKMAWEGVKQSYLQRGEPIPIAPSKKNYTGQFNIRIDKRLHKALAIEAAQADMSLNALVAQKLAQLTSIQT